MAQLIGATLGALVILLIASGKAGYSVAAIHLVGINVTGVSVNPARSFGPAVIVGGTALVDLWVFIVAPLAGGLLAGIVYKTGLTRAEG